MAALQRAVATDPAMLGTVAVTPSGCLGPCFDGPVVVAYPDGTWLSGAGADDVDELRAWLAGGPAPAGLVHDWPTDDDDQ